jgi:hypothetical protein
VCFTSLSRKRIAAASFMEWNVIKDRANLDKQRKCT